MEKPKYRGFPAYGTPEWDDLKKPLDLRDIIEENRLEDERMRRESDERIAARKKAEAEKKGDASP